MNSISSKNAKKIPLQNRGIKSILLLVLFVEDITALWAELRRIMRIIRYPAALVALIERCICRLLLTAVLAELACVLITALAGPCIRISCRSLLLRCLLLGSLLIRSLLISSTHAALRCISIRIVAVRVVSGSSAGISVVAQSE